MLAKWLASLTLLTPLAVGGPDASVGAVEGDVIKVVAGDGVSVESLLVTAQQLVGGTWFYEPKDLKDARVHLIADVEVPRERFLVFLDKCLANSDFAHVEMRGPQTTTHRIMKLGQQARGQQTMKTLAPVVTAAELVSTLNLYFADSATESIRNVEDTRFILMTGFSDNIWGLLRLATALETAAENDPALQAERANMQQLQQRVDALERQFAALRDRAPATGGK